MNAREFFRSANQRFFKNWGSYLTLTYLTNLVIIFLMIPLFNWLTAQLLAWQKVPYVSYTNLLTIATKRPIALIGLLLILLLIMIVIYWQFSFILLGVLNIQNKQHKNPLELLMDTVSSIRHASIKTLLFFIFYFIVIIPFGSAIFSTPLLNKAKIPAFILNYLMAQPLTAGLVLVFYLGVAYLGIRWIHILPLMIIEQKSASDALKESWQVTKGHFWRYMRTIVLFFVVVGLITWGLYLILYVAQLYFDTTKIALATATIALFIVEVFSQLVACYIAVISMMLMIDEQPQSSFSTLSFTKTSKMGTATRLAILLGIFVISAGLVGYNLLYLNGAEMSKPIVISHRGVDDGNGVQNTIPALKKTAKEKPAYVEMDIHETKDHQFVVMHDENLKELTGVNKAPYQLTLAQLTKLTARENGHAAKVPSFDEYYQTAIKLHQKLLIEIKTTPHDSANATQLFLNRYAKRIKQHKDQIHTLDYQTMVDVKRLEPTIYVSYILPYNLTFPKTVANGYTMEVTTLNARFVDQAHQAKQKVYAWDIDSISQLDQMMFLNTDAIITDNLAEMKTEIKENTDHPSYANLLLTFMNQVDFSRSPE